MASIQDPGVCESRLDDSHSLIESLLALERPDAKDPRPARRTLDRLLTPPCDLRALRVCTVFVLVIAATACIGIVQLATQHVESMRRPTVELWFTTGSGQERPGVPVGAVPDAGQREEVATADR